MRQRPVLAAAVAVVVLALLAPVAYAVVTRVFLSVDPEQSEEAIEEDVRGQLQAAGIAEPVVQARKDGDRLEIGISTPDEKLSQAELDVAVRGEGDHTEEQQARKVSVEVACELTSEQMSALTRLVSGEALVALMRDGTGQSDDELAAALRALLAGAGFRDVEIAVARESIDLVVKAPPGPAAR
ncbi:MAG TPA: hypothetical protein VNO33_16110 [Kofleriaceae bacterium]|nr:hypothetical protein [Kofleriaceae bacterium]